MSIKSEALICECDCRSGPSHAPPLRGYVLVYSLLRVLATKTMSETSGQTPRSVAAVQALIDKTAERRVHERDQRKHDEKDSRFDQRGDSGPCLRNTIV